MTIRTIAALALLCATSAHAAPAANGNDYVRRCNSKAEIMWCVGYARGIADGFNIWNIVDPESAKICIPKRVDAKQLVEVTLKFIAFNPEIRDRDVADLMAIAFKETWPCKKDNGK